MDAYSGDIMLTVLDDTLWTPEAMMLVTINEPDKCAAEDWVRGDVYFTTVVTLNQVTNTKVTS